MPGYDEKKEADVRQPKTLRDIEEEMKEATKQLNNQIEKINGHIKTARTKRNKTEKEQQELLKYHSNGGRVGAVGDSIYVDNAKRYDKALAAVERLVKSFTTLIDKLSELKRELEVLVQVVERMTSWAKDADMLTTTGTLKMVFPELNWESVSLTKAFDLKTLVLTLGVFGTFGGIITSICVYAEKLALISGGLIIIATIGIGAIVACGFQGSQNKQVYEDVQKKADKSADEILKCVEPVQKSINNIDDYWEKISYALERAGILDRDKKVRRQVIKRKINALADEVKKNGVFLLFQCWFQT